MLKTCPDEVSPSLTDERLDSVTITVREVGRCHGPPEVDGLLDPPLTPAIVAVLPVVAGLAGLRERDIG